MEEVCSLPQTPKAEVSEDKRSRAMKTTNMSGAHFDDNCHYSSGSLFFSFTSFLVYIVVNDLLWSGLLSGAC